MTMDQGSFSDPTTESSTSSDRLQQAAGSVAERVSDTAQQQVGTQVNSQLSRAGDMLEQLASAVRRSGDQMRDQQPQVAEIADTAAQQVDRASQFLRRTDMNGLIREAEDFARQQPAVFLGGALALGLIASRFLKASPQSDRGSFARGLSSGYGGYGTGYGGRGYARGGYGAGRWSGPETAYGGRSTGQGGYGQSETWTEVESPAPSATGWSEREHGGL